MNPSPLSALLMSAMRPAAQRPLADAGGQAAAARAPTSDGR